MENTRHILNDPNNPRVLERVFELAKNLSKPFNSFQFLSILFSRFKIVSPGDPNISAHPDVNKGAELARKARQTFKPAHYRSYPPSRLPVSGNNKFRPGR